MYQIENFRIKKQVSSLTKFLAFFPLSVSPPGLIIHIMSVNKSPPLSTHNKPNTDFRRTSEWYGKFKGTVIK